MRYSSSSASRSPCCARSTSPRMRSGASARSAPPTTSLAAIRRCFPSSTGAEPHARLPQRPAQVDDPAQRDGVAPVLRIERDGAVAADRALELVSGRSLDQHAEGLAAVEADFDPNALSHVTPPP